MIINDIKYKQIIGVKIRVVGTEKIRKAIVKHKKTIEPFGIAV